MQSFTKTKKAVESIRRKKARADVAKVRLWLFLYYMVTFLRIRRGRPR